MPLHRGTRIGLLTLLGAALVVAWVIALRPKSAGPAPSDTWVAPIQASTDSGDARVRGALRAAIESDGLEWGYMQQEALFLRCGVDSNIPREEYTLWIGDYLVRENAKAWKVVMIPRVSEVDVWVTDVALGPPPPEPPPGSAGRRRPPPPPPQPIHVTPQKVSLSAVRLALSNPNAWRTQENVIGCLDGRPALLTACVDGRFHASLHQCGGEPAIDTLWGALQDALPAPPASQ